MVASIRWKKGKVVLCQFCKKNYHWSHSKRCRECFIGVKYRVGKMLKAPELYEKSGRAKRLARKNATT